VTNRSINSKLENASLLCTLDIAFYFIYKVSFANSLLMFSVHEVVYCDMCCVQRLFVKLVPLSLLVSLNVF